jgi:surfeit locus 1 family protein
MKRLRARDVGLLVLLSAAAILCIRLGFWQLARLDQRLARNQAIQGQLARPVITFSTSEEDYQRVILEGTFLPEYEFLLQNRALDEQAGFHLVTPLQISPDTVVLVDRGWISYEEGSRFELEAFRQEGTVRLQGILLPSQAEPNWKFLADSIPDPDAPPLRSWRVMYIEGLQAQMPFSLHSQFALLTAIEPTTDSMPIPDFQIDLSNGPHLSYAIQWFSFAAISLIGGAIILRRSLLIRS